MKTKSDFSSCCAKRVSYIIATKNRAKILDKKFLKLRQLLKPQDELIIIDGFSSDTTLDVIKKNIDIVDIYISEPDQGPAHAVNKGMLLAHGRYIKEFPDDDEIYPEAMEKALKVMDKNPFIDLLICGGQKQHGQYYANVYLPPGTNYGRSVEDVFKYGACGVGFIVRRKSLTIGGLYPTTIISDNHFVLEFISKGLNVKFCRINLFKHPIYKRSTIIRRQKEVLAESYRLMKQYCSWSFYLKNRLRDFTNRLLGVMYRQFKQKSLLYALLLPLRFLNQKFIIEKKQKREIQNNLVWDGGFS